MVIPADAGIFTEDPAQRRSRLVHGAKFSELAGYHVVAGFCMTLPAGLVAERSGLSEKTVRGLYVDLRDRLMQPTFNRWHEMNPGFINFTQFSQSMDFVPQRLVWALECAANTTCHRNFRLGNRKSRVCRKCPFRTSALAEFADDLVKGVHAVQNFYTAIGWRADEGKDTLVYLKRYYHVHAMTRVLRHTRHTAEGFPRADDDGFLSAATLCRIMVAIRPNLLQPSSKARNSLLKAIRERIRSGKSDITTAKREPHADNTQRYAQTLVGVDRVLRGWGNAFAYGNASLNDLDLSIDAELNSFRGWYSEQVKGQDWKARRRTGGIALLTDIKRKSLADVPFRIEGQRPARRSSAAVTISTDGSAITGKRRGKDRGPGGWAFVVHNTGEERSGADADVTNNQMELRAVIEALKFVPSDKHLFIRTDSKYVANAASGENAVQSNTSMWTEYQELARGRHIKFVWVKGHNGDPHNERADLLASQRSLEQMEPRRAA